MKIKVIWFCLRKTISGSYLKQNNSFGRHVGGQEYALQNGGQYKSFYFVEKSKCHKISPLNAFPLKFRVWDDVCVLYQFLASARFQLIVLKEALVTWPLSASGLLQCNVLVQLKMNLDCSRIAKEIPMALVECLSREGGRHCFILASDKNKERSEKFSK